MKWEYPVYIYMLLLLPLAAFISIYFEYRRNRHIRSVVSSEELILFSFRKIYLKRVLFIISLFFILLALAGPRWGKNWQRVNRPAREVMFVIDVSKSMLAQDMIPSRMELLRKKTKFIAENVKDIKAGIIFFSGIAFVHCPLTFDMQALNLFLNDAWDSMIPLPGTNIESALKLAAESFGPPVALADRYIVLLTDGEELQGNVKRSLKILKENRIKVISLALGTEKGSTIPDPSAVEGSLLKDKDGNTVVSRTDKDLLRQISSATEGYSFSASEDTRDVLRIVDIINKSRAVKTRDEMISELNYQYQGPLFIALILLILEFALSDRKFRK